MPSVDARGLTETESVEHVCVVAAGNTAPDDPVVDASNLGGFTIDGIKTAQQADYSIKTIVELLHRFDTQPPWGEVQNTGLSHYWSKMVFCTDVSIATTDL